VGHPNPLETAVSIARIAKPGGDIGRDAARLASVRVGLELLEAAAGP
jgi:hypothetical protein